MLDIKFIRENPDLIREAARKKHLPFKVEELLAVDEERLKLLAEAESLRHEQKQANLDVATANRQAKDTMVARLRELKEQFQQKEAALAEAKKHWQKLMLEAPNVPDVSVPEGRSEADNQELRRGGVLPKFPFPVKNHIELMQNLGLLDLERGAKVAGFRGYYLLGDAARLSLALWQYTLDFFRQRGFAPMLAPALVNQMPLIGTGYLPQGAADLYRTQGRNYLSGTAEAAVMGYFMDEIIPREKLPLKIIAFSPCFRREAGSHGKDTKGLFRVHEFFKLELVILCAASHNESVKQHEALTADAEALVDSLGLAYRVVVNYGGDLGLGQVKKHDLEVWFPSQDRYRETHSASYFHDFQTRRLNIRYRDENQKLTFGHSLNNTAAATPRLLAALVENYQQAAGAVAVPPALRSYLGGDERLAPLHGFAA